MTPASITTIARRLNFVRETQGPNAGAWVNGFQRYCHGKSGDSWCADFVSFVMDFAYYGNAPLKLTGSTRDMLAEATSKNLRSPKPVIDGLFFYVNADGTPHHVGIVSDVLPTGVVMGIAGNTSEDGVSSNGTGVFEHAISTARTVFVRLS
jgi:hypothetical protein